MLDTPMLKMEMRNTNLSAWTSYSSYKLTF